MSRINSILENKAVKQVVKFASASVVASLVDFLLFRFVFYGWLDLFYAELAAAFCGMLVNFYLQKKFVFNLNRKLGPAFFLSIAFSLVFMTLGAFLMTQLVKIEIFKEYITIPKIFVMGIKFVLNFITKRWVFEKTWK